MPRRKSGSKTPKRHKTSYFYGIGKVPSGRRRAGPIRSLERRQVRYYGARAIPHQIVEVYKDGGYRPLGLGMRRRRRS